MKSVLPDVDETAGGQVYLIGQELQKLHSIVQSQMTATKKTNHSSFIEPFLYTQTVVLSIFRKLEIQDAELYPLLTFDWSQCTRTAPCLLCHPPAAALAPSRPAQLQQQEPFAESGRQKAGGRLSLSELWL